MGGLAYLVTETGKVVPDLPDWSVVCDLSPRHENELIEKLERSRRRLVNRRNDKDLSSRQQLSLLLFLSTYLMSLRHIPNEIHHFKARRRIQPTSRLI